MQNNKKTSEQKNIAICIPSTDHFTSDFSMCLAQLCHLTHHHLAFVNTRSSYIPDNRNNAVKAVLNANMQLTRSQQISHILFLDNDMIFPLDIIDRLLSREKSIVAGTYPMRSAPHSLCYVPLKAGDGGQEVNAAGQVVLEEVAGLPTGSMLIDVHVFNQIPQPWYEQKYYFLPDVEPAHEEANVLSEYLNEFIPGVAAECDFPISISCDYWFSALCRAAGYKLWLDRELSALLEHVGQRALKITDSINWKQQNQLSESDHK